MLKTKVLIFTKPMFSYFLSLKIFTHILSASFSLILCEICENLAICYSLLKCGIVRSKIIKISIIMLAIIKYKRFYSIIINIQGWFICIIHIPIIKSQAFLSSWIVSFYFYIGKKFNSIAINFNREILIAT